MSDKLGLTGESKRRTIARYERSDRNPKEDRLLEIANILNVMEEWDYMRGLRKTTWFGGWN